MEPKRFHSSSRNQTNIQQQYSEIICILSCYCPRNPHCSSFPSLQPAACAPGMGIDITHCVCTDLQLQVESLRCNGMMAVCVIDAVEPQVKHVYDMDCCQRTAAFQFKHRKTTSTTIVFYQCFDYGYTPQLHA